MKLVQKTYEGIAGWNVKGAGGGGGCSGCIPSVGLYLMMSGSLDTSSNDVEETTSSSIDIGESWRMFILSSRLLISIVIGASETLELRQQIAIQPHIQVASDAAAPRHPNVVRISTSTAIVFN